MILYSGVKPNEQDVYDWFPCLCFGPSFFICCLRTLVKCMGLTLLLFGSLYLLCALKDSCCTSKSSTGAVFSQLTSHYTELQISWLKEIFPAHIKILLTCLHISNNDLIV